MGITAVYGAQESDKEFRLYGVDYRALPDHCLQLYVPVFAQRPPEAACVPR